MVAAANAAVGTITIKNLVSRNDVVFVDVRENGEVAVQGKVPRASHALRGLLEFYADPTTPYHKPELASGGRLVVYCASGGRSALAAKPKDMGIDNVANMRGGFAAWQQGDGRIER